ncbi:fimbrial protein [Trabulsiella odontotermitis]|uniref:fimbrial protein n=1 Tax=Trabulsiella odontotermitis TaxID=379893 RepID=UPI00067646E7|nr:hypothetical protein [Trabulsiella odontotermitis]KNC88532.1 hypothetical protein GM30_11645 [Trabulsiella odontotermitis]
MKKYSFILIGALLAPFATFAGDGQSTIDLTFTGTVVQPSCKIVFDNGTAAKTVDFGTVNVSDLRYYASGSDVFSDGYNKSLVSSTFQMQFSECSAENLVADSNGKLFKITIGAGANSAWNMSSDGNNYVYGGLSPTSGATDFMARVLIPRYYPVSGTDPNNGWTVLTVSGADKGRNYTNSIVDSAPVTSLSVNFDDLAPLGQGTWALPMKVELGMKDTGLGQNVGAFSISAVMTVTYY